jgi:hypothetical protein
MGSFFHLGHTPALALPQSLERHTKKTTKKTSGGADKAPAEEPTKKPTTPKKGASKVDPWIKNKSFVPTWGIPKGKTFTEFFGKGIYENQAGFPHMKHHVSGITVPQCLGFTSKGGCSRGAHCSMAHVDSKKMEPEEFDATDKRFKSIFA